LGEVRGPSISRQDALPPATPRLATNYRESGLVHRRLAAVNRAIGERSEFCRNLPFDYNSFGKALAINSMQY
jgi:hypothetical protein